MREQALTYAQTHQAETLEALKAFLRIPSVSMLPEHSGDMVQAAQWLVDNGARAIGFDCFSEYCARLPDFTSEDFIIHKVILENGAILMQQMTNLSQLPTDRRVQFFAPFIKIRGAEGSPARFFALVED